MSLGDTSIKFIEYLLGFLGLLVLLIIPRFFVTPYTTSGINPIYIIISIIALFILTNSEEKYPLNFHRINIYNVMKISLVYWIVLAILVWVSLLLLNYLGVFV